MPSPTRRALLIVAAFLLTMDGASADSTCFGSVSNGRLEDAVQLRERGANFSAYSSLAVTIGRTYVHSRVARIVEEAYAKLETTSPSVMFVYGETGWRNGSRLKPHRTHQNGLSVDFFVPVRNQRGDSVPLPTTSGNRYGYGIEFDNKATFENLSIDFNALAEYLYQLNAAAIKHNAPISLVIFDTTYMPRLLATPRGDAIRNLPFMKGKPWVRHDEHFHVDFSIPCLPLKRGK